jgi:hypothetical protein
MLDMYYPLRIFSADQNAPPAAAARYSLFIGIRRIA